MVVIGHSQGCLVALELNRILKNSLEALIFVAGSNEIPVNQFLLDLSKKIPKASQMMVTWDMELMVTCQLINGRTFPLWRR